MEKKIRFGVIGTGRIVDWVMAGACQDPRFELIAVYSRQADTARAFADRYRLPYAYTSLDEMLDNAEIDAVYIASPNYKHAEQAIACIERGKHVLCEKPIASNARETKAMTESARRHGVTLMEAMITTLNPNFEVIRSNIARLGTVRHYFASYCQYSSRYDAYKEGTILNAFKRELSNGAIMDIGVYTIYPLVALFGRPTYIRATGTLLSTGVDGQGTVNFGYPEMNATIVYSKIANSYLPSEIQGETAALLIDEIHAPAAVQFIPRTKTGGEPGKSVHPQQIGVTVEKNVYYYEIAEFINLIEQGRRESEVNSHANSLITIEIIDEIRRQLGVTFPADSPK